MIVEDHNYFRETLCASLKEQGFPIIYEAINGKKALEQLNDVQPDIVIMDIRMPVMSGLEALRIIKQHYPNIKVIILTENNSKVYISESINIGADAFLKKNCDIEVLVSVIKDMGSKRSLVYENVQESVTISEGELNAKKIVTQRALTAKEAEILVKLCEGNSRKVMADHFNISERTVGFHIDNIYKKTKAKSLAGLIMYAIENGYILVSKSR